MAAGRIFKTYITGFDESLGGGIPESQVVLLTGPPGSMKSTIAYNMAYRNCKNDGVKALYVTLDRNRDQFLAPFTRGGLGDPGANLIIFDISTIRSNMSQFKGGNWWEPFKNYLVDYKYNAPFDLFILDSLQVLELVVKLPDARTDIYQMFEWLRDRLKVTAVLISEMPRDSAKFSKYDEEILVDGIIQTTLFEGESGIERRIRCIKMAGAPHSTNYFRLNGRDGELYAEQAGKRAPGIGPTPFVPPSPGPDTYSF